MEMAGGIVLSVGLSYLGSVLTRQKPKNPAKDTKLPALASRGDFVPMIIGRRKTTGVFGWVGNRKAKKIEVPGSSGLGTASLGGYKYSDEGWHQICVGPARRLERIWRDSKQVWKPASDVVGFTQPGSPSGTEISVKNVGKLRWYWGENNQPVNEWLGDDSRVGVTSAWPGLTYCVWDRIEHGAVPTWGVLDYQVVCYPCTTLTGSAAWVEDSAPGVFDGGVNAAHALMAILQGPYPWGFALPSKYIDWGAAVDLGAYCAANRVVVNIAARDGVSGAEVVGRVLAERAFAMPMVNGMLRLLRLRKPDPSDIVTLDEDCLADAAPEETDDIEKNRADRVVYLYDDAASSFRQRDVVAGDDSMPIDRGRLRTDQQDLFTTTSAKDAKKIADLLYQTSLVSAKIIPARVLRGARSIVPGQPVDMPGQGVCRVLTRRFEFDNGGVATLNLVRDLYSIDASSLDVSYPDPPPPPSDPQVPDRYFLPYEMDRGLGPDAAEPNVIVPRLRATSITLGGDSIISDSAGASYAPFGSYLNAASGGGQLVGGLDAVYESPSGPCLRFSDPTLDSDALTGVISDALWKSGQRVGIVGDGELFYFRNVEALGGGVYRVVDVIRDPLQSTRRGGPGSGYVVLFDRGSIQPLAHQLLIPQTRVNVKAYPTGVDPGDVAATPLDVVGKRGGVLPVCDCYCFPTNRDWQQIDQYNRFVVGQDVVIRWQYRVASTSNLAAGNAPVGVAIPGGTGGTIVGSDGGFVIEIRTLDGSEIKRTFTPSIGSTQQTYSSANRASDFPSNESFLVLVYSVVGGVRSTPWRLVCSLTT